MPRRHMSGLPVARFLMVMGSLSPLFVLWAIRGTREIPDKWWGSFCLACVIIPNLTLYWRWHIAHARNDHRVIIVLSARDQSEHLLVYLFAMLIPLFGVDLGGTRDIVAVLVAFAFIVLYFLAYEPSLHERALRSFWIPGVYCRSSDLRNPRRQEF